MADTFIPTSKDLVSVSRVQSFSDPQKEQARSNISAAASSHDHGNISSGGAIGSTANLPLITGTSGILQAGSFGTTANTFCQGNDARLSDARTPTAHTHSASDVNSGVLDIGRIPLGSTASTVCVGNDYRLSDARTPTAHTHPPTDLTGTLAKAQQHAATAYTDQDNTFNGNITTSGTVTATGNSMLGGLRLNGADTDHTIYNGNRPLGVVVDSGNTIFIGRVGLVHGIAVNATTGNLTASGNIAINGPAASTMFTGPRILVTGEDGSLNFQMSGTSGVGIIQNYSTGNAIQINPFGGPVSFGGNITASGTGKLGDFTVGTLPSAAANAGHEAVVINSSVTTFGATVSGGGSSRVKVFSNGTNWTVQAA